MTFSNAARQYMFGCNRKARALRVRDDAAAHRVVLLKEVIHLFQVLQQLFLASKAHRKSWVCYEGSRSWISPSSRNGWIEHVWVT